jgi:hypothetical protein
MVGTARVIVHAERAGVVVEPFVAGRYEEGQTDHRRRQRVGVSAGANRSSTWRVPIRSSSAAEIGSGLLGAALEYRVGTRAGQPHRRGRTELPHAGRGTSSFTQLTLNGTIEFPTFICSGSTVEALAVATAGDSDTAIALCVPRPAVGTLPLMELAGAGGDQLVFVESRYRIGVARIVVPKLGSPTIHLRHIMAPRA